MISAAAAHGTMRLKGERYAEDQESATQPSQRQAERGRDHPAAPQADQRARAQCRAVQKPAHHAPARAAGTLTYDARRDEGGGGESIQPGGLYPGNEGDAESGQVKWPQNRPTLPFVSVGLGPSRRES